MYSILQYSVYVRVCVYIYIYIYMYIYKVGNAASGFGTNACTPSPPGHHCMSGVY